MTNRPQTLYEIYAAPRSCVERAYPKLIHYNKLDKGGHFAAWEQPELFASEMRVAFQITSLICREPQHDLRKSAAHDQRPRHRGRIARHDDV